RTLSAPLTGRTALCSFPTRRSSDLWLRSRRKPAPLRRRRAGTKRGRCPRTPRSHPTSEPRQTESAQAAGRSIGSTHRAWCPWGCPFPCRGQRGSGRRRCPAGRSRHGGAAGVSGRGAVVAAAVVALDGDIDAGVPGPADIGVVGLTCRAVRGHATPRVGVHVVHVRPGGVVARRGHDDGRLL